MPDNPHGKFIWNELNTHDAEASKAFLAATLGWSFEAMPMPDFTYWVVKNGEERIGGIFEFHEPACENAPEHWLTYVAVDDVDTRCKKASAAGARMLREPFDVPGVGRIAIVQQPGGAAVAWMTPKDMQ